MKKKSVKTQREIDEAVIATADDNAAWEKPVRVKRAKGESVSLPAEMAARAAFFARRVRWACRAFSRAAFDGACQGWRRTGA